MRVEKGQGSIYLHDLESGATQRVSTTPGFSDQASWTPDGRAVFLGQHRRHARLIPPDAGFGGGATVDREGVLGRIRDGRRTVRDYTVSDPKTASSHGPPAVGSGAPVALAANSLNES